MPICVFVTFDVTFPQKKAQKMRKKKAQNETQPTISNLPLPNLPRDPIGPIIFEYLLKGGGKLTQTSYVSLDKLTTPRRGIMCNITCGATKYRYYHRTKGIIFIFWHYQNEQTLQICLYIIYMNVQNETVCSDSRSGNGVNPISTTLSSYLFIRIA